jgi:hypothetical protein
MVLILAYIIYMLSHGMDRRMQHIGQHNTKEQSTGIHMAKERSKFLAGGTQGGLSFPLSL